MTKIEAELRGDPRIKSLEREPGNGWWVDLNKGSAFGGVGEAHCFSEARLSDVKRQLGKRGAVVPCDCSECRK